mgnify:CR=1 FL=1
MPNIVTIGDIKCGGDELFLIAGPCVIEDESVMMKTAEKLKKISERLAIPVIFKSSFQKDNRSSLKNYPGPGLKNGMKMLAKIKKEFGFPILTDIHHPEQAARAAEVADVLQIPAYMSMQSDLIVAAARTDRVVNIKHGQFMAPEHMKNPVAKCEDSGNKRILLTERGYTFGYADLIVDPRSFYHLRNIGYPVVFDVTHSVRKHGIPSVDPRGSSREFLPVLGRAAAGSGLDGLFIETHPEPQKGLCDGSSMICVYDLEEFLKPLIELHNVEVSHRHNTA